MAKVKSKLVDYAWYGRILMAAEIHGLDSEPDHEIGDLQEALSIAWGLLDEKGRKTLAKRFFEEVAEDVPYTPRWPHCKSNARPRKE